jgi:hypothetical protein
MSWEIRFENQALFFNGCSGFEPSAQKWLCPRVGHTF